MDPNSPVRGYNPETHMTKRQVAEFFQVHPRTIDNWSRKGLLSPRKAGFTHFVIFARDEVENLKRQFENPTGQ